jgi:hypothetical protein
MDKAKELLKLSEEDMTIKKIIDSHVDKKMGKEFEEVVPQFMVLRAIKENFLEISRDILKEYHNEAEEMHKKMLDLKHRGNMFETLFKKTEA